MIIDELKRAAPSRLEVLCADDSTQKVAISRSGKRWDRAVKVLDGLDWTEVRMFDLRDNLVGTIRRDAPDDEGDDEDDDEGDEGESGMRESAIARVVMQTMRATMAEVRRMFEVQLRAQADAMGQLTEANRMVIDSYRHAMELQRAWLTAPDKEGENNMGEVMNMMQMASMFLAQRKQPAAVTPGNGG